MDFFYGDKINQKKFRFILYPLVSIKETIIDVFIISIGYINITLKYI